MQLTKNNEISKYEKGLKEGEYLKVSNKIKRIFYNLSPVSASYEDEFIPNCSNPLHEVWENAIPLTNDEIQALSKEQRNNIVNWAMQGIESVFKDNVDYFLEDFAMRPERYEEQKFQLLLSYENVINPQLISPTECEILFSYFRQLIKKSSNYILVHSEDFTESNITSPNNNQTHKVMFSQLTAEVSQSLVLEFYQDCLTLLLKFTHHAMEDVENLWIEKLQRGLSLQDKERYKEFLKKPLSYEILTNIKLVEERGLIERRIYCLPKLNIFLTHIEEMLEIEPKENLKRISKFVWELTIRLSTIHFSQQEDRELIKSIVKLLNEKGEKFMNIK